MGACPSHMEVKHTYIAVEMISITYITLLILTNDEHISD